MTPIERLKHQTSLATNRNARLDQTRTHVVVPISEEHVMFVFLCIDGKVLEWNNSTRDYAVWDSVDAFLGDMERDFAE